MANVLFKQGLQSSLDQIRANLTATEGTFYLTTDSHRLYIGRINGEGQTATACDAVPVNEGVTYVNSLNELPTITTAADKRLYAGQFYYVGNSNILCVYSGSTADGATNGGWVQINPNTDTKVDGFEYTVTVSNNVATIQGRVNLTTPQGVTGGEYYQDTHTITGAGSVYVTANGTDGLTITGDEYTLDSSVTNGVASITLQDTQHSTKNTSIGVVGGSAVQIDEDNQGNIRISADDTQLDQVTVGAGNGASGTEGFYVRVQDALNGTTSNIRTGTIDPVVAVGSDTTVSGNQVHFVNGTATLPVYSKADVDGMMANLNAMTFKGVVSSTSNPPTTNVQVGDTYKASENFTFLNNGISTEISKGDLIIATGTETNGVITSGLQWEVIPAGNDTDDIFRYKGVAVTHGISLNETMGSNDQGSAGRLTLAEGNMISLTDTVSGTGNMNNEITVSHATHAAPTTSSAGTVQQDVFTTQTVTAITGIGVDSYGHIDSYATTTWQLTDTAGRLTAANTNITASNDHTSATITNGTYSSHPTSGTDLGYVTASHNISSSTLSLSATAATINNVSHVQTAPATLTIDLVWGSF
ncbi:MAG: hypothetical protein J6T34_00620 [Bacilli bacterium]|nr:hypothetical protein [Bacilli bacterium]